MRKRTAKKLVKSVDDILSSMEMLTKFKENSYMVSKVKNVYSDNMAVLENEKDAGQRYSELLDEFKKKIESSDIEGSKKTADDFKNLISDSIVYKVVFMPYKASMWDSLESVWMAADKDERCEAIVVPITYYELDSNRNPVKKVNERDEFPKYVPVVNDEEYDLETDRPDIIYIHNPYDDTNLVTRVEGKYYSWNLKKYCEKLVYIPYYKWVDGVSSTIFKPAMYYADYTVQCSDDAVKRCIEASPEYAKVLGMENVEVRNAMEEKLINLGCPKVDKVSSLNEKMAEMPKEWKNNILESRVNVLYNTTIDEILKSKSLGKIRETLNYFKRNTQRSFVIWRPHPLFRQTLVSMLPSLVDEYDEIVDGFTSCEYGILDTNANMYYAMFWSDMYYGFNTSSMTELYKYTGKIVLEYEQNINIVNGVKSLEKLSERLKEVNVVSEPEYSLSNVIDAILKDDKLKQGKCMSLESSGSKINEYMMNEIMN